MKAVIVEEDMMLLVVLLQKLARLLCSFLCQTRQAECRLLLDIKLDLVWSGHGRSR